MNLAENNNNLPNGATDFSAPRPEPSTAANPPADGNSLADLMQLQNILTAELCNELRAIKRAYYLDLFLKRGVSIIIWLTLAWFGWQTYQSIQAWWETGIIQKFTNSVEKIGELQEKTQSTEELIKKYLPSFNN